MSPTLIVEHKPPWCDHAAHRDGTFWGWLRWFFATVKCDHKLAGDTE